MIEHTCMITKCDQLLGQRQILHRSVNIDECIHCKALKGMVKYQSLHYKRISNKQNKKLLSYYVIQIITLNQQSQVHLPKSQVHVSSGLKVYNERKVKQIDCYVYRKGYCACKSPGTCTCMCTCTSTIFLVLVQTFEASNYIWSMQFAI